MTFNNLGRCFTIALLAFSLFGCNSASSSAVSDSTDTTQAAPYAMYVASNSSGTNSVLTYTRDSTGTLSFAAETATGGSGSGTDGGSCGNSIYLDSTTDLLYVVNSGSNSISLFYVNTDGTLSLLDVTNSGGVNPVSIAVNYNVAYVLNAGDGTTAANIKGFQISGGQFLELSGATANLSTTLPGAAKIQFAPAGTLLTVTEQTTGLIANFDLDASLSTPTLIANTSVGTGPSGFDYTPGGILLVAERFADTTNAGAVSSYSVGVSGAATPITSSVAVNQTGTNCVKVVSDGSYALVSNAGSNNVGVLSIAANGTLSLTSEQETTGTTPTEIATSSDGAFAYVLNSGADSISVFSYAAGNLTPLTTLPGLPASARGLTGR